VAAVPWVRVMAGLCTLVGMLAISPAHLSTINNTPLSLYPLANDPFTNPAQIRAWTKPPRGWAPNKPHFCSPTREQQIGGSGGSLEPPGPLS
jgi:hypothetical protein